MVNQKPIGAESFVPDTPKISELREAAQRCRGCDLYKPATQTVFGEGPASAKLMLVGETPGDHEDQEGHPFVGPAGRLLREILGELDLKPKSIYLTNAVKHFKFEERGKRRIHSKPLASEVTACRAWLEAEIGSVKPRVILCLGATAAHALMGSSFSVVKERGKPFETRWAKVLMATYHPSAILRAPDPETRSAMRANLTADISEAMRRAESPVAARLKKG